MEYYRIAVVARPHGVQGFVKLTPLTDNTARFKGMTNAYLEQDGKRRPVGLSGVSVAPDAVLLKIEGVDTREQAELLRGAYLCVDKQNVVKLPPGHYFIADLIGCLVEDNEGVSYGKVTDVLQTGANDVYVIKQNEHEILLPALKKVLLLVDVENKRIVLDAKIVKEVAVFED
ncbi:ribosome maturation factor RimM [Eubacteriales bacterium OttesenSCG-928-K08]|nr:ribosome maturation factor RimM [Eubacteriales bacterium OttesenSCG-928-K08]